jgi:hypothetical protein
MSLLKRLFSRNEAAPATISGNIVQERHVALNWLTSFQNDFGVAWDDTDMPS